MIQSIIGTSFKSTSPFTGYTGDLTLVFNNINNVTIGNVNSVEDWNTFFDLPNWSTPFTSVSVVGNDVILSGGENIVIKEDKFRYNTNLISIVDLGCVAYLEDFCFNLCNFLTTIDFPALTIADSYCFWSCSSLTTINMPQLETVGRYFFSDCNSLESIYLPALTVTDDSFLQNCISLTDINLPVCTNLGGSVVDDNVFDNINGNTITLTIPASLMTFNSGNPDGDIQILQANNTVTIVETVP
jgi:hypothetical protein